MNNFLSKWNEVLRDMQKLVSVVSYELYVETLEPIKVDNNKFVVLASTSTNKRRLLELHKDKILNVIKDYFEGVDEIIVLEPSEKEAFLEDIKQAEEIVKKYEMEVIEDSGLIDSLVDEVISENAKAIEDYHNGRTNMLDYLVGQVMKKSRGKANPVEAKAKMIEKIS